MDWVKVILTSKRAQAAIVSILVALAGKYEFGLDEATATKIVAAICSWIIGESVRPVISPATSVKP